LCRRGTDHAPTSAACRRRPDPAREDLDMKHSTRKARRQSITRREFVGGALAAGAMVAGAPALLRGRNLNSKLDIAFIGAGGRANASLAELTIEPGRERRPSRNLAPGVPHPDENVAVLCDINQQT